MERDESFGHFLLAHQQRHGRTLNFVILMESIITAAKQIRHHYSRGALEEGLGEAGTTNVQGEKVMQMDVLAHETILHYLRESKQVIEATSEEVKEELPLNDDGRYFIYFDPLDGSSNIKHSLPVGFLFGIAKRNLEGPEDRHIRAGKEFIAAGMFLIPSGQFTFALRDSGAWRFLMDDTWTYVKPTRVMFPENKKSWELSWNAGNRHTFSDPVQQWIADHEKSFNFRYTGALVVDFHRLLHNGGMFFYPAIVNHPKPENNRPEGKLRLMYECNVVAFIAKEAGGLAIDEQGRDILEIEPQDRHQRSSLYVGSREVVESIRRSLR